MRWKATAHEQGLAARGRRRPTPRRPASRVEAAKIRQPMAGLDELAGLAAARGLPAPEHQHRRQADERRQAVQRLQPGHRHAEGPDLQLDMVADPEVVGVPDLALGDPEQVATGTRQISAATRRHSCAVRGALAIRSARRPSTGTTDAVRPDRRQADQHADPGETEAEVPAVRLGEGAGDHGRDEGAEVDHRIIELEGDVAAPSSCR